MNRHAASAQIESEDVDAVSVFITGDKDNSARNANMEDFTVFASIDEAETAGSVHELRGREGGRSRNERFVGFRTWRNFFASSISMACQTRYPMANENIDAHTRRRGSSIRSLICTKVVRKMNMVHVCCAIG